MRLFDSNAGDSYDYAHLSLDWDYIQTSVSPSVSIESAIPGMTGNCTAMSPQAVSGYDTMLRRNLDNYHATLFVGFRFRCTGLPLAGSSYLCGFWDTGNIQCMVQLDSAGRISLWSSYLLNGTGGTLLAQSPSGIVHPNTNIHIGILVTYGHSSNGSITIYADSVAVLTASGLTTATYSTAGADQFSIHSGQLSGVSTIFYFDDIYVEDGLPSKIDQKGITCFATADGQYSEQTIGGTTPAATRWQSVNAVIPNDGVTLVSAASAGLRDTYKVTNLPSNVASIESVTVLLDASTNTSGLGVGSTVASLVGNGTTIAAATAQSVNTSYYYKRFMYALNPVTSAAFTLVNWNAGSGGVEFGSKRVA